MQVAGGRRPAAGRDGPRARRADPGPQRRAAARARFEQSLAEFRRVFPAALCYAQIVPVDEVVTLVLFHREDEALARLMLDEAERAEARPALGRAAVRQPGRPEGQGSLRPVHGVRHPGRRRPPLRAPPQADRRAGRGPAQAAGRRPSRSTSTPWSRSPSRAYRRPLTEPERAGLRDLYAGLRDAEARPRRRLPADARPRPDGARRSSTTPRTAGGGRRGPSRSPTGNSPAGSATSSGRRMPDDELRRLAGRRDARTTRTSWRPRPGGCSRTTGSGRWRPSSPASGSTSAGSTRTTRRASRSSPSSPPCAAAMYEESVRFFVDLFRRDGSVLDVLDADHTFVNGALARHYGIPGVDRPRLAAGRRGEGARPGRHPGDGDPALEAVGGVADQPGPPGQLALGDAPRREAAEAAEERPAAARERAGHRRPDDAADHREAPRRRVVREVPRPDRPVRVRPRRLRRHRPAPDGRPRRAARSTRRPSSKDGTEFADIAGLRDYLLTKRRDEFLGHFCRKLLGYSLGRSVQLSDEPLAGRDAAASSPSERLPRPVRDHGGPPEPAVPLRRGPRIARSTGKPSNP